MSATTGITAIGDYANAANDEAAVDILLGLIPNNDAAHGSGANAPNQGGGHLDEMSPAAAAAIRVELLALKDAIGTTNTL